MLRRLKSEVQFKLPSKKEIYLYVGLSPLQKSLYKQILTKNIDSINGVNRDKIQLLNVLMQLKKVCNHPYLFPKIEEGPPYITGEHLIDNSMKMIVLDRLLALKYSEKSKVLIFSQMVTVINILDDYCRYRGYKFCRIDGSTSRDDRDNQIENFQAPESDIFIFLLSTRSGGLGINLYAANTVIIYDSDWNPQVDLQAIDRAHRIGQTKPVTVYRFVAEGTVEEKIVERAAKKLKIDNLIIQKGKAIQNKPSALEINNMIQFGANNIFQEDGGSKELNIEEVLEYSENKTHEIYGKLKSLEDKMKITNLSLLSNSNDIYRFEGEDYKNFTVNESANFLNISNFGSRERKFIYSNLQSNTANDQKRKPRVLTGWKAKVNGGYEHQLFNRERLDRLDNKEKQWNDYLALLEKANETGDPIDGIPEPQEFTQADEDERARMLSLGYDNWSKKDFSRLCEALKTVMVDNYEELSRLVKNKTPQDIEQYLKSLLPSLNKLKGGIKLQARIKNVQAENEKIENYHVKIRRLFDDIAEKSEEIYSKMNLSNLPKLPNKQAVESQSKNVDLLNLDDDKYLLCMLFKYGYGNWGQIRFHIMFDPKMSFNICLATR